MNILFYTDFAHNATPAARDGDPAAVCSLNSLRLHICNQKFNNHYVVTYALMNASSNHFAIVTSKGGYFATLCWSDKRARRMVTGWIKIANTFQKCVRDYAGVWMRFRIFHGRYIITKNCDCENGIWCENSLSSEHNYNTIRAFKLICVTSSS